MLRKETRNTLRCGNQLIELKSPLVMGVVNATPDSFYQASRAEYSVEKALEMASLMLVEGATILDIGGMSSRPGAEEVPLAEELNRVISVIEAISATFPQAVISVDTYRAQVAAKAIRAGATMVNDISGGLLDPGMLRVVADTQAAYVLMHMRGTPGTMQHYTDYQFIMVDLIKYFVKQLAEFQRAGVQELVLDPGFGFSKTLGQNYTLINQLSLFRFLELPILIGVSRKSTLSKTIGRPTEETLEATTALHMAALQNGASILRVHDVRPAMDAIAVFNQLEAARALDNKRLNPA
jgi:dihydropteroate synthase